MQVKISRDLHEFLTMFTYLKVKWSTDPEASRNQTPGWAIKHDFAKNEFPSRTAAEANEPSMADSPDYSGWVAAV
jgi:hypothetical protein